MSMSMLIPSLEDIDLPLTCQRRPTSACQTGTWTSTRAQSSILLVSLVSYLTNAWLPTLSSPLLCSHFLGLTASGRTWRRGKCLATPTTLWRIKCNNTHAHVCQRLRFGTLWSIAFPSLSPGLDLYI